MALGRTLYNVFFRRSSAFMVTILVGAVFFERTFDYGTDALWERMNQGRLWKHIKHEATADEGADVVMLELEVIPERALSGGQWEFVLGMPLSQAVDILKRHCNAIKSVEFRYSEQRPLDVDLVMDLLDDGIKLSFDPKCQRLKMMEVYDIKKVKLKYCNKFFSSPAVPPTVEQIHHSFGPTLPGQVDLKQQLYLLLFRGILFVFPVWNTTDTAPVFAGDSADLTGLDSQRSLLLTRVCIFSGNNPSEARAPSLPLECFHGNGYSNRVQMVKEGGVITGLRLNLISDDPHSKLGETRPKVAERIVQFGDTAQDVCCALGSPDKTFFKAEDKMRIHSPSPHNLPTARSSDYFFNYFTLGLDVLFDATTSRVKKFVMHTNVPGHYNFNIYYRCDFVITFVVGKELLSGDSKATEISITPSTKWSEVQDYLTRPADKPVVLNRSSSTNSINPFGSTFCYGYQNLIFEVMHNHHIGSVTVYCKQ